MGHRSEKGAICEIKMDPWLALGGILLFTLLLVFNYVWKLSKKKKVKAEPLDDCKLVFCVRNDLKMGKGKIAAQCGHATVMCLLKSQKKHSPFLEHWLEHCQTKVALRVDSLEELLRPAGD